MLADLTEEEKFLYALLMDSSGIDSAELLWLDNTTEDNLFRSWDYQVALWRNESKLQVDLASRSIGKSTGVTLRAFAHPFVSPGEEMLLGAPEMIFLDPLTRAVERRINSVRLSREMLKTNATSQGFTHRPFEATFRNGARIVGRIPQADGRGFKGCCSFNHLVLTYHGFKMMAEVEPGDFVLTHAGRFMPVLHVYSYEDADCVRVKGRGSPGIVVSTNHRFWARRNSNPQRTRNLGDATWLIVDDEEAPKRWYWASPAEFPSLPIPAFPSEVRADQAFLWMCGRYVADGFLDGRASHGGYTGVAVVDSLEGIEEFEAIARLVGYEPHRQKHDNAHRTRIHRTELAVWLDEHFGHMSDGKKVPVWLLGAPGYLREAFLDGYLTGDGTYNKEKRRWDVGSASKALALGVKMLGQTLGYSTGMIEYDPKVTHIAGVELKNKPKRHYRTQLSEHATAIVGPGGAVGPVYQWGRIRSIEPAEPQMVYDLVVAEDFSYVADGIVHKGSRFLPGDGD